MPHEVIKRVGRRAYRYRVESYRDPETKKVRSRWTYLGRVARHGDGLAPAAETAVARRAPLQTRERLIAAFERLVGRLPYAAVTAGMVAAEAGLAHGTFYRYFSDKRAVFTAALERTRDELERARPSFDPPIGTLAEERARVRAWIEAILVRPASNPGVLRVYFDILEVDEALRTARRERRLELIAALAGYLERLSDSYIVEVAEPAALATALLALVDAVFREAVVSGSAVEAATVAGVVAVFDRTIFRS
jgi:AcrR family transcriptional regulator